MVPMMMPVVMPMMVPARAGDRRRGDGERNRRRENVTQFLHVDLRGLNNGVQTRSEVKGSARSRMVDERMRDASRGAATRDDLIWVFCPVFPQKIFMFVFTANQRLNPAILSRQRGARERHERWGRLRWALAPSLRARALRTCGGVGAGKTVWS